MFEKLCRCTPKSAAKWEKNRAKGKSHFVWLYGVLGWGLPMFVFMTAFYYHQNPNSLARILIINTIVWPIAGYSFGVSMWSMNEKAYKKYREQKTPV